MRAFLYSKDFPQGKIFTDKKEYEDAIKNGCVKSPVDVKTDEPAFRAIKPSKKKKVS